MTTKQKKRKPLTPAQLDRVFMEAGYMCANPRCRTLLILNAHHIVWVKDDGTNDPQNLLALCPTCHAAYHEGRFSTEAIRHWKAMLLAMNHAFDRRSMELLLYLTQPKTTYVWYSGEGVLQFAGLMAAGLVEITHSEATEELAREYPDGMGQHPPFCTGTFTRSSHRVGLTDKGRLLVEAWLSEDGDKYKAFLHQPWATARSE